MGRVQDEGRVVGERYRLVELIGQGAVADVWRARDTRLARDVALKMFRGDAAAELGDAQEEVRTLARLDHPNLVAVLDTGTESDGTAWIVTQYVDGESLDALIAAGPLSQPDVAWYGAEVAAALGYVHGQGLVHRDVKPGNVLVGRNGRVYLTDFGIARIVDAPAKTVANVMVGTPAFLAPEQVAGERVGPPADVYALGLLLLEALTGQREYPGAAIESAAARLHRDPQVPTELPPAWRNVLAGMTTRDPAGRPTAAQVERRLRTIVEGGADTTMVAPLPVPGAVAAGAAGAAAAADQTAMMPPVTRQVVTEEPMPRRGPGAGLIALLVLVALAAVAAAIYLATSGGGKDTPAPHVTTPPPTPAATSAAPSSPSPTSESPTPTPTPTPTPVQTTPPPSPTPVQTTPPPSPTPVQTTTSPIVSIGTGSGGNNGGGNGNGSSPTPTTTP